MKTDFLKKLIYRAFLIIATSATVTACSDSDDGNNNPPMPPAATSSRTVIAYMVATNNLNGAASDDLAQMSKAVKNGALGKNGNLLVYCTAIGQDPVLVKFNSDGTTRRLREYDTDSESLDPDFMAGVINDAMTLAPSDDYGLILWSHSTGWRGLKVKQSAPAARAFGDDNGHQMAIPDLATALSKVGHLKFIYFDSCFMGNMESLYELRNAAEWIMASPAETPYDGAPYDVSLAPLYDELPAGLTQSAVLTYNLYMSKSDESARSLTLSVYRMSAAETVATAAADIISSTEKLSSTGQLQQYGFPIRLAYFPDNFFDINDYLESRKPTAALHNALSTALSSFIVTAWCTPTMWGNYPLDRACGLSIYPYDELPALADSYAYKDLQWYKRVYE